MESDGEAETVSEADKTEELASFSRVSAVATEWMLDFLFITLCRRFKEGNLDEFSKTLSVVEAISQDDCLKGAAHKDKILICAFLARVMHGKELDVQFEEGNSAMPLTSAAKLWSDLKHTVDDDSLFQSVTVLLLVQSVAVCLEQGSKSSASSALKWLEKSRECPQNVRVKLTTVVTKMETYHPLLRSFSFDRLLESIQSYLDTYLKKNPSDYLLKAATEVVQSSPDMEDEVSQDSNCSNSNKSVQKNKKSKRKLLPSASSDFWIPDAIKRSSVSVKRLSRQELFQVTSAKSMDTSRVINKRKAREKWTPRLDKRLEDGVKCHGVGKWSLILKDYDFEGRTGTMLKDRWRVLLNAHLK
ncbi:telomeric repeat-binding factor 1 [Nematolebias whitei]|uniref:telomeric repeat-binding factor 1 n=1 Tax=Nematolebias whitei TaxID=451745 RepID=UPI00189A2A23|nr:telomeric repeat-binding factor 1 [Nematolebias whitei]